MFQMSISDTYFPNYNRAYTFDRIGQTVFPIAKRMLRRGLLFCHLSFTTWNDDAG